MFQQAQALVYLQAPPTTIDPLELVIIGLICLVVVAYLIRRS